MEATPHSNTTAHNNAINLTSFPLALQRRRLLRRSASSLETEGEKFMARIVLAVLLLLCLDASYAQESRRCSKVKSNETTCWGWIQGHTPEDGGTVKEIRGKVVAPNEEAVPDALIELYDNPDLDFDQRKRVAACRVGANGEFRFKGLRPGKYELRGSYCGGAGFDAGHTIITFAPKDKGASKTEILVKLNLSQ